MNGIVEIVVVGTIIVAGLLPRGVYGEADFFDHGEPSQHVMHIRKLSDADRLKIELEPVWFHLESTERRSASDSQQVKRQAKEDTRRPFRIFSSIEHFERLGRGNEDVSKESGDEGSDSFLKNFWQTDKPTTTSVKHEIPEVEAPSVEQQLQNVNLPNCFRKYLHEMYDRNHESVRKLMRCLAQHSEESCNDARRVDRVHPHYISSLEEDYFPKDDRSPYERKMVRKRKYSEPHDATSPSASSGEDLKFEKQFIRSDDSDYGGQIFEPVPEPASDEGSDRSDSSNESQDSNRVGKARRQESGESTESDYDRSSREYPKAYRRMPQKYNTDKRYQRRSEESEQDSSSSDDSGESCQHC